MKLTKEQDEVMNGVISDLETLARNSDIETHEILSRTELRNIAKSALERLNSLWNEINAK